MGTRDTVRDTVINRQPPLPAANPRERDPDLERLSWILELDRNRNWTVFAGLRFTMGTRDTVRDTVINRQPPLPAANPRERDPDLERLGWILELDRNRDWTVFAGLGFTMGTRDTVGTRWLTANRHCQPPTHENEILTWNCLTGSWNLSAWLDPGTCQLGWILELVRNRNLDRNSKGRAVQNNTPCCGSRPPAYPSFSTDGHVF